MPLCEFGRFDRFGKNRGLCIDQRMTPGLTISKAVLTAERYEEQRGEIDLCLSDESSSS